MEKIDWADGSFCCWVDGPKGEGKKVKDWPCELIITRYKMGLYVYYAPCEYKSWLVSDMT